jgi:TonB-dependent receptor
MRIKPFTWFDIRLAYSTTLSYPDFTAIIPEVTMDNGFSVSYNNYQLVPTQSKNYDAYLSFSDNTIGLFTAGGFYKKIENLIYRYNFNLPDSLAQPYLPGYNTTGTGKVYAITTYVNDPYKAIVYGLEFDWQTHLWYLPNPFKGLVFNINFTHIYSKAEYPYKTLVTPPGRGSRSRIVDTSYIDPLLDQPNNIVNLSIGYDYRGFSIRVSMLYKDEVFQDPSYWQQNRSITAAYKRWDISVKQDLPFPGLQAYCNLNNLNNAQDFAGIQAYPTIPVSEQVYAMTVELGLRWQL